MLIIAARGFAGLVNQGAELSHSSFRVHLLEIHSTLLSTLCFVDLTY
jgi:hypothetical protein